MAQAGISQVGSRLVELLSRQYMLYKQLRELAHKQTELVDGKDPETLLKVLGTRQKLINRLSAIDQDLQPIRADWQKVSAQLNNEQRQEVQRLVADVQQVLGEILSRDEKDFKALTQQKQMVAEQIRTTSKGQRVNQAYGQYKGLGESKYLDTSK